MVTEQDRALAGAFETHRAYLHAIALRTLGSPADADDAVQEAWLRLARTGGDGIEDLRRWLTTVTGRICLDLLRRRTTRAETPLELTVDLPARGAGPEDEAVLAESVALALFVVMDALTPAERVSFVLHDIFDVPFDAVGAMLDRSTAAAKMLASRARSRIRLGSPATVEDTAARAVVEAFYAAAGNGDLAGLLAVLAPDVELRQHGRSGTVVVRGSESVAAQASFGARLREDAALRPVVVDGAPGALVVVAGRPVAIMSFTVTDGLITAISAMSDPVLLAEVVPTFALD